VSLDARLERLLPALSGRERATLALRDFKARKPRDRRLAWDMDGTDRRDYDRLMRLMDACNLQALMAIVLLVQRTQKAGLKLGWLATLEMWDEHAALLERHLRSYADGPAPFAPYCTLLSAGPERWAPACELADVLTSRKEDWRPEQLDEDGAVLAEEWERESRRNEGKIARLVKAGTLEGRRLGGRLRVRAASFAAWLGEEPLADAGRAEDASLGPEEVSRRFAARAAPVPEDPEAAPELPLHRALALALGPALQAEVTATWSELAAFDAALAKVAEEFGGEDPVRPETREEIDAALAALREQAQQLAYLGYECQLPAVNEEEVRQCLEFINHFAGP
jgi:hypothetical protein